MGALIGSAVKRDAAYTKLQLERKQISISRTIARTQKQVGDMKTRITQMENSSKQQITAQYNIDLQNSLASVEPELRGQVTAQMEAQKTAQLEEAARYYDFMREAQLDPLTDLEKELTEEKEQVEADLTQAKAEYELAKKMEQEGIKNLLTYNNG